MSGLALKTTGYDEALSFLYERIDYERAAPFPDRCAGLHLERMRDLLRRLGNPEQRLRVIHLAGTKGKGSTATMVSAILRAAGFKVGLYTSPHLERLEERFAVDGTPATKEQLLELIQAVRPAISELDALFHGSGPTFFEITTAIAFLHFSRQRVDFAVLEVGMGGRLDSTNVCHPILSVITSISYDHTQQLGNTLREIAGEKAGIIKPGIPVVSGVLQSEPQEVIRQRAARCDSKLFEINADFGYELHATVIREDKWPLSEVSYYEGRGAARLRYDHIGLAAVGRHQAGNAALAVAAVRRISDMGDTVSEQAIRDGLGGVHIPARVEFVGQPPRVVIDTSHNVASVQALVDVLERIPDVRRRILLFATTRDKDAEGMLAELLRCFDSIVLTRYSDNPRAMEPALLAELARHQAATMPADRSMIYVAPNPSSAWAQCQSLAEDDDLVCIAGSFFLAAELRPLILRAHS